MESFDSFLLRMEELFARLDELEEPVREDVFELLDGIDAVHRRALVRLVEMLDDREVERLAKDQEVGWLLEAYGLVAGADGSHEPVPVEIIKKRSN